MSSSKYTVHCVLDPPLATPVKQTSEIGYTTIKVRFVNGVLCVIGVHHVSCASLDLVRVGRLKRASPGGYYYLHRSLPLAVQSVSAKARPFEILAATAA
jgi:hypothetical protein